MTVIVWPLYMGKMAVVMIVPMKRLLLILSLSGVTLSAAELSAVHSVYLLPMGNSLDQYLANRLTSEHVFLVVTDPKLAHAVFTDRIGAAFEEKLADLLSVPAAAPSQPAANQGGTTQPSPVPAGTLLTETVNKLSNPATNSSFGRGKGTIFLVDTKSKQVIWSFYEPPKGSTGQQLDRGASDIVNHLKRDLKGSEGKP
jgi:hypothetical protein